MILQNDLIELEKIDDATLGYESIGACLENGKWLKVLTPCAPEGKTARIEVSLSLLFYKVHSI